MTSNSIRRSATPVALAALDAFESQIGHPLPAEYRDALEIANGGVPRRTSFRFTLSSGKTRKARVLAFAPVSADGWDEVLSLPLNDLWESDNAELVAGTIGVGTAETDVNLGTIRLGVVGDAVGRIYFRPENTARDQVYLVAASWNEFLNGLTPAGKPEPWDAVIEDGNPAEVRAWLESHRPKWDDGCGIIEVGRKAVAENQAAIIDLLVDEFDFSAASLLDDALDAHRLDLAIRLLPRAAASAPELLRSTLNREGPYLWHTPSLVRALLDAGADASDENDCGLTPLHHAARAGSAEMVQVLLDRGADPSLTSDEGETPRQLAERGEWSVVTAILRTAEANQTAKDFGSIDPFELLGVHFVRTGAPITLDEILAVEAGLKLSFPPEYRWLLLQANGAILRPGLLPPSAVPELYRSDDDVEAEEETDNNEIIADEGPEIRLDLYPLRQVDCPSDEPEIDDDGPSLLCSAEEMAGWYHDGSEIPRGCLPIGKLEGYGCDGSGFLLLGCRGSKRGRLFAFDHGLTPLNLNLPELFARLAEAGKRPRSPAERLADAIEARDLGAVRDAAAERAAHAWMTRDGRIPLRMACDAKFDDAVVLLGEQSDRARAITEALMADRVAVARRLFEGDGKLGRETLHEMLAYPALYTDPEFLVQVLNRGIKLETLLQARRSNSPLVTAVESGSVAGLQVLLDRGGKVDWVDHEAGTTLLHQAVRDTRFDTRPMITRFCWGAGSRSAPGIVRARRPSTSRSRQTTPGPPAP